MCSAVRVCVGRDVRRQTQKGNTTVGGGDMCVCVCVCETYIGRGCKGKQSFPPPDECVCRHLYRHRHRHTSFSVCVTYGGGGFSLGFSRLPRRRAHTRTARRFTPTNPTLNSVTAATAATRHNTSLYHTHVKTFEDFSGAQAHINNMLVVSPPPRTLYFRFGLRERENGRFNRF